MRRIDRKVEKEVSALTIQSIPSIPQSLLFIPIFSQANGALLILGEPRKAL